MKAAAEASGHSFMPVQLGAEARCPGDGAGAEACGRWSLPEGAKALLLGMSPLAHGVLQMHGALGCPWAPVQLRLLRAFRTGAPPDGISQPWPAPSGLGTS